MFKITRKSRLVKVAAATAAVGSIAAFGLVGNSPAQADPKAFTALVAVGSDTTQDVLNAFAGFSNSFNYTPLQSSLASSQTQIISFDAGATSCIATRTGGPSFLRPNGSSAGVGALSQIGLATTTWGAGNATCPNVDVSGNIDFARSSSGPATQVNPDLTYVPFARDALTFAYYSKNAAPGNDTDRANLTNIFTKGFGIIGTTVTIPCSIQTSSGTYNSWNTAVQVTGAQMQTGATLCNGLAGVPDSAGRLQEHNGPQLKAKGDALAGISSPVCDGSDALPNPSVSCANAQVIVGFSASQFVARSNGRALPAPGPGVALGSIAGKTFVTGTAPTVAPNALATGGYADTVFGRDVYNVFLTGQLTTSNAVLQSLFVGSGSAVCQADATVSLLGFIPLPDAQCGTTTLTGDFVVRNS